MYSVSSAFRAAMNDPVQEHKITGTIGSVSFDESNIVDGSFSISNQSTDTNDVVLGSCYVGELTAEFTGLSIGWSSWIGKVITPSFGLKVGNSWETVPLGIFKISKATHTAFGVQVTAYDYMTKFDKKFKKSHFMNLAGMYNIISQMCTDCGVTFGMTQAQIEALPNGDRTGINIYGSKGKKAEFANDIATNRDLLFWIAQTLGCFATINRSGQLEFRKYTQNVSDVISDAHRIEGATFEDYITHYIGIYVENLDDNTEDYYGYDTAALTAELQETSAEISSDQEDITELQADLVEWAEKLAHGECTQAEYDAAVAEINAQIKAKQKDIKQLTKRVSWLEKAIQSSADDGSDMVLGANPLCMAANKTTRDQQRREILGALDDISYTPFTASVVCGCIYDLGDVIQFSGGLYNSENDSFGCVMAYTYTHNGGTELQGFGVDPAIVVVRNKTQKSVDRASKNSVDSQRIQVGSYDPNIGEGSSTTPLPVSGKNGDVYIKTNGGNIDEEPLQRLYANVNSTGTNPCSIYDFSGNNANGYEFKFDGYPDNQGHGEHGWFTLQGLEIGKRYHVEFDGQFLVSNGWPWSAYNDGVNFCDATITFNYDMDLHHYSCDFTYDFDGKMDIYFHRSQDNKPLTFKFSNIQFTPLETGTDSLYYYSNTDGKWNTIDYAKRATPTQGQTGGTEIAEISNSDGTKTKIYQKTVEANPTGTPSETLQTMNIGGELYSLGGGNVDDVMVDNVSVVTNKIANINTMTGADGTNAGAKGLVPAPAAADNEKYLRGDGTWQTVQGGGSVEMLAPTPFIYSETEEQVGIWIDGKPLYGKTVSTGGSAPTGTTLIYRLAQTGYDSIYYTKLSDTAWQGGFKAYGFTPVIYSEEEREIGVWRDGKPLYQKTLTINNFNINTTLGHRYYGYFNIAQYINDIELMWVDSDMSHIIISSVERQDINGEYQSGDMVIYSNTSRSNVTLILTVQYTKTTDTAGSGEYTTLGTPAVHYSTDEQVIGTWIDGSTLYGITVVNTTGISSINAWSEIADIGSGKNIRKATIKIETSVGDIYDGYQGQGATFDCIVNMSSSVVKTLGKVSGILGNGANWLRNLPITLILEYTKTS